ncbi:MAG: MerR family transcriptional regulator [Bacilli bacterium]|nr:MerR family transcriptional regulator [Bacilli bacterium]
MFNKTYSVEEVSSQFGITPRTLHYYEEIGLISEIPRTEGGHRFYNQQIVDQLSHIIRIKNLLGISLQAIAPILAAEKNLEQIKDLYHKEDSDDQKLKLLEQCSELLQSLTHTIDDKIRNLQLLREGFAKRLEKVNVLLKERS